MHESNVTDVIRAAEFRASLREFLRKDERIAHDAGLTPQRYQLLLMIKGAPDRSQSANIGELTQRLQLAQSTVTELVQRAIAVGLVDHDPAVHDGREVRVRLTPEGERRLAKAFSELSPERPRLAAALLGDLQM